MSVANVARKRTLKEYFDGNEDAGQDLAQKTTKSEKKKRKPLVDMKHENLDDIDQEVDKALKEAQKVL